VAAAREPLVHHELCFGCGRANLFGLMAELARTAPGEVAGRCFIKQDHQGADRGTAHDGVLAAALCEAMALAAGPDARLTGVEVSFEGPAPVGVFLELGVRLDDAGLRATATASAEGNPVASATGTLTRR